MIPLYTKVYKEPVQFAHALGYAYEALVNAGVAFDAMAAWKGLNERIAQGVYMGSGLLLPHTRVSGLKEPLMAFVAAPSIEGANAKDKSQFLCLLLSPAESPTAHTMVIAEIAKHLLDPGWKEKALSASSAEELKSLF